MIGGIAQVKIVLRSRGKFPDSSGFQPVVSARRDDRSFPTDIPERSDAIILLISINAPLLTIDRVRPIFLEYQNHGLEARATTADARARNSGHTRQKGSAFSCVLIFSKALRTASTN